MKTKFAIGCLIQWYEVDIIKEYIDTLKEAINYYDGEVLVDFTIVLNQDLEKVKGDPEHSSRSHGGILYAIDKKIHKYIREIEYGCKKQVINTRAKSTNKLVTIADYRRKFNDDYCEKVDVLVWGESDMLVPKQMFTILNNLHQMSLQNNNPKYLSFFGTCKMWDDSWKILEHPDFTDKPFFDSPKDFDPEKHWWSLRYTMSKDEMNKINDKTEELEVLIAPQHKFNGCGLVISSEVIKSGVNIPRSVFFVHEDTAFMQMTNKILGNIPQYIIKNILLVHNRNHPKKRMHVRDERKDGTMNEKRRSNDWYVKANEMSEQNCYNILNPNYKSFTWKDVWK
jgi:hypothetical protein